MSFSFYQMRKGMVSQYAHFIKKKRKEQESGYITQVCSGHREKASISASFVHCPLLASVTVEAVMVLPIFVYAAVCLIWMLELRALQLTVRSALQTAAIELSVELAEIPVLLPSILEGKIEDVIGEERIHRSMIVDGIHCEGSYIWGTTGIMELTAEYEAKLPVPEFVIPSLSYQEAMRVKAWNGYVKGGAIGSEKEQVVYITETGVVYHTNYHCNYLNLSIKRVSKEEVGGLRNQEGSKYYVCERCGSVGATEVYITDYGNRYHCSASCSGLKRKIYAVPLSEVKGKGVCSKCGK